VRLQRIMLVQAARADPVSLGNARPLAPNPRRTAGESLEDRLTVPILALSAALGGQTAIHEVL
jgi:hypothetical protein